MDWEEEIRIVWKMSPVQSGENIGTGHERLVVQGWLLSFLAPWSRRRGHHLTSVRLSVRGGTSNSCPRGGRAGQAEP